MNEIFEVPGTEGFYGVDKEGNVWSCHVQGSQSKKGDWHKLKLINKSIHYSVNIHLPDRSRKRRPVHQLVLETFVGPCPPGHECLHKDGNGLNNKPENLRWGTSQENHQDQRLHGTYIHGVRHPAAKLTDEKADSIRQKYSEGRSISFLAKEFDVSGATIRKVISGRSWMHTKSASTIKSENRRLRCSFKGGKNPRAKINEDLVREMRGLYDSGIKTCEIARRFQLDRRHAWSIVTRRYWKHLP